MVLPYGVGSPDDNEARQACVSVETEPRGEVNSGSLNPVGSQEGWYGEQMLIADKPREYSQVQEAICT